MKSMATKTTERDEGEVAAPEQQSDGPLLDLTDAAVRRMIKLAKKRGYVTYEELNEVLPSEEFSSEQIEDVLGQLSEMGINVVESEEADDGQNPEAAAQGRRGRGARERRRGRRAGPDPRGRGARDHQGAHRPHGRSGAHVPARDGLGGAPVPRGRNRHRQAHRGRPRGHDRGLCESPLTFQAIIIWRDELVEGRVLLRDIIDLEATYAGPDGKGAPAEALANGEDAAPEGEDGEPPVPPEGGDLDDDDMENNVSLSAMEAELKPRVSKPSTASPTTTRSCAGCRSSMWSSACRTSSSPRPRSASTGP
jgi:RNA polymerase primary sigma factor